MNSTEEIMHLDNEEGMKETRPRQPTREEVLKFLRGDVENKCCSPLSGGECRGCPASLKREMKSISYMCGCSAPIKTRCVFMALRHIETIDGATEFSDEPGRLALLDYWQRHDMD